MLHQKRAHAIRGFDLDRLRPPVTSPRRARHGEKPKPVVVRTGIWNPVLPHLRIGHTLLDPLDDQIDVSTHRSRTPRLSLEKHQQVTPWYGGGTTPSAAVPETSAMRCRIPTRHCSCRS